MTTYINFFPGSIRDERELSLNDEVHYCFHDIIALVYAMIMGCTCSAPVDGALAALEDGSIWGDLVAKHGDAVQGAIEEVHALISAQAAAASQ